MTEDPYLEHKIAFLRRLGAGKRPHSGRSLLAHLLGTRTLLEVWGADPALCDAGLFHSVYGTESYRTAIIPLELRSEVCAMIGHEAEKLAFLFGVKKGSSFYADARRESRRELQPARQEAAAQDFRMYHRLTGEWIPFSRRQLIELVNLSIANAVEQAESLTRENAEAERRLMREISPLALPGAKQAIDRLFPL